MRIKRVLAMVVAAVALCSCSYTTTYIGSITTYNADGSVLKKWDKVCLHEQSNNYTTGNAFKPYVVEYDIIKRNPNDDPDDVFKMELINRHEHLCYMLEEYKINLKYSRKDSEEHKKWKEIVQRTKIEINNITYTLSHEYSYYLD